MHLAIYEDALASQFDPIALTRPVMELICGMSTLAEKQLRAFPAGEVGYIVRPELVDVLREGPSRPPINDEAWLGAGPLGLVNGRWLPGPQAAFPMDRPLIGLCEGEIAFAIVDPADLPQPIVENVDELLTSLRLRYPATDVGGHWLTRPWDLVHRNGEQLISDFQARPDTLFDFRASSGVFPSQLALLGPRERLFIDPSAQIDPMVMIDTRNGPVIVGPQAVIQAFSRIEGPCCIGPRTQLCGANLRAGSMLGPECRMGGEIEASIVQGYTNKYHDGFLGHSYLGCWINLGAGTHTSDLRNDYGRVKVTQNGERVATGSAKVGSFIGDHTKSGLGCLLNTGSVIGPFCNLLPSGKLLPKYLPAFCTTEYESIAGRSDVDAMLATAGAVMARRGETLTPVKAEFYRDLHGRTASERRRAVLVAERIERRTLRRAG